MAASRTADIREIVRRNRPEWPRRSFLAGLKPSVMHDFLDAGELVWFRKGEVLVSEGDLGSDVAPQCTDQIISQYMDPPMDPPPLHFQVVGACTTAGGTLTSVSSNFTPGAAYSVQAFDPNGDAYPLTYDHGTVHSDGSVTWQWPCAGVPAGTYSTTLVDESDGQQIGPVYFTVGPAPSAPGTSSPPAAVVPGPSNPAPGTYTEQEWHTGANTFTDPDNASGLGPKIAAGQYVQVTCKLYDPSILSASPGGYWYKIASSPWDNQYYAVANTFLNGDPWAGPYTHPTDLSVPDC